MIPIPRYKVLAIKKVWSYGKELPELLEYFPDIEEDELPDRLLMWGVVGALQRDAWQTMLEEARMAWSLGNDESKDELKEILPQILEEIMTVPISSKGNNCNLIANSISKRKVELDICLRAKDSQDFHGRTIGIPIQLWNAERIQHSGGRRMSK